MIGSHLASRVVELDGAPWFVAADVCDVLGFEKHPTNRTYVHHLRRLDADETVSFGVPTIENGRQRRRSQKIISESGLYKLVLRSDKPQAKEFQDWV